LSQRLTTAEVKIAAAYGALRERQLAHDLLESMERADALCAELADLRRAASGVGALYDRYTEKGDTSALMADLQVAVSPIVRMLHYGPEQSADADRLHEEDLKMWRVLAP
jgi:hypothetical protein